MYKVNYDVRKKTFKIFRDNKVERYSSLLIIRNLSQLHNQGAKKFNQGRSEHLFLLGEIEEGFDLKGIRTIPNTRLIYYPSKHEEFRVNTPGKSDVGLSEYLKEGSIDVLCRIRNYHPSISILDKGK